MQNEEKQRGVGELCEDFLPLGFEDEYSLPVFGQEPFCPSLRREDSGDSVESLASVRRTESTDSMGSIGEYPWAEDEARKRRALLDHKAQKARENRKRKKNLLLDLQRKVMELQLELNKRASSPPQTLERPPVSFPMDISNPEDALCGFAEKVVEQMEANRAQLNLLQAKLAPCLAIRFLQWILSQDEKFYAEPDGLWFVMFIQIVNSTPHQLDLLMNLRREFLDQRSVVLPGGAEMARGAFDALHRSLDDSSRLLANFLQIFTPEQLVMFFKWVETHGAGCIR